MSKNVQFWTPLGPYFGSLLTSSLLQHGFQSSQDGSKTTEGASKTPLICLQGRPSPSQDASQTTQDVPKALQELPRRLSEPSRALQERVFETPSHFQELSGAPFQTSSFCPAASSLWRASGLWPASVTLNICCVTMSCDMSSEIMEVHFGFGVLFHAKRLRGALERSICLLS